MKDLLDKIDQRLERDYVTQEEFRPVKAVVYGLIGLIMTTVIGALITLVIKQ
jgi:hypothetical protein